MLELADIQSGALHPRPSPYVGCYILIRIDDRRAGRELLKRLIPVLAPATDPAHAGQEAWVSAALTYQGLKALGVPQNSLDSFSPEFQQGMAARAATLGDTGENAPEHWEKPFGTPDIHLAISALSPDKARLEALLARARQAYEKTPGITAIWRLDCYAPPTEAEHLGSETASVTRPSREAAFPERIPKSCLSRPANSFWATSTRRAGFP
jgi:deferrochelatase/peroxidase EfeB